MKFTRLEIPDVILIEPDVLEDSRGFFFEAYHEREFREQGIDVRFVQDNHSRSSRGVLRGLHWQEAPHEQAKLIRVIRGEVFDVAVDIRKKSKTFGRYVTAVLSEENKKMLYVPKGFAHGFCVLKDGSEFLYKVTDFYAPECERGIIWNDPALGIPWPDIGMPFILSERDKKHPVFMGSEPGL